MNITNINRTGEAMHDNTITSLFSLIVAIFAVGGMVGGLAAGWWADFFGRYMLLPSVVSVFLCCLSFVVVTVFLCAVTIIRF